MTLLEYINTIEDDQKMIYIGCTGGSGFFLIATSGWLKENLPTLHDDFKQIGRESLFNANVRYDEAIAWKDILESPATKNARIDRRKNDILKVKRMIARWKMIVLKDMEIDNISERMTGGVSVLLQGDINGRYWCLEEWKYDYPDGINKCDLYKQIYNKTSNGGVRRGMTWDQQKRRKSRQ